MKKLLVSTLAASVFAAMAPAAQAATTTDTFNVAITLTPACTVSTPAADFSVTYVSGGGAVNDGTNAIGVTCTLGAPVTLSMDGVAGSGNYGPFTDADTGLQYTLAFNADGTTAGDKSLTGNGATEVSTTIGINFAGAQAGKCTAGLCNNSANVPTHTVYVNY